MSVSYLPPMKAASRQPNANANASLQPPPPDDLTPPTSATSLEFPPVTPMPRPNVREGDEQYAGVEGQVVWEGDVQDKYRLFRDESAGGAWVAVWKGEVHVGEFMLGLTSSSECEMCYEEAELIMGYQHMYARRSKIPSYP